MASLAPESSAGAVAFEPHGAARGGVAVGERFGQRKKEALLEALSCGADKSKKGSFDAPIQDMLDHLNLHSDYVSTS
ncbi:hypothetical protein T484DRAFT_1810263 [Baffinella frigidus]|nr:hypothetical protein T484DRAFT_1810263 [Cryptophyta sp. CCMP2293]